MTPGVIINQTLVREAFPLVAFSTLHFLSKSSAHDKKHSMTLVVESNRYIFQNLQIWRKHLELGNNADRLSLYVCLMLFRCIVRPWRILLRRAKRRERHRKWP